MELLPAPRTLLDGLTMVESARWHDGRLWFAHWGAGEVVAVDLDGNAEVVAPGPDGLGWSIDWLPDGRLITTGPETTVHHGDGTRSTWSTQGGNEVVVHPDGQVYVNGFDFDFLGGGVPEPGWIRRIDPDGTVTGVADDIHFPNGMVLTPDGSTLVVAESMARRLTAFDVGADGSLGGRRVWADGLGPDGICLDAGLGVWAQMPFEPGGGVCLRVRDGGEITHRVETQLSCFSCAVGGPGGRTLFLLCNEFEGVDRVEAMLARKSARVEVVDLSDISGR
ncbi:SMP-30/gluconolactonase/LRE family protein [Pseudonocardia nematodicida]|uniref:SMP-30/gluconolactonase/LRE family protein n=1 Tax=Pseudonocardia nematodicida TaxID=1206997 RepID=A0ABV1KGX2_9PSEU